MPRGYIGLLNNNTSNYTTPTQKRKHQRHEFLLTFFDLPHKYDVKEVNGFILNRYKNNSNGEWEVAVYTKEGWAKVEKWKSEQGDVVATALPFK